MNAQQIYYCPCCSKPMRAQIQEYGYGIKPAIQLDCKNPKCVLCINCVTTSPNFILQNQIAEKWGFEQKYNLYTGEEK